MSTAVVSLSIPRMTQNVPLASETAANGRSGHKSSRRKPHKISQTSSSESALACKVAQLPLKKRFYAETAPSEEIPDKKPRLEDSSSETTGSPESAQVVPDCGDQAMPSPVQTSANHPVKTTEQPVDFTLPNRSRAKPEPLSPSKHSVSLSSGIIKEEQTCITSPPASEISAQLAVNPALTPDLLETLRLANLQSSLTNFYPSFGLPALPNSMLQNYQAMKLLPFGFPPTGSPGLFPGLLNPAPVFPTSPDLNLLKLAAASSAALQQQSPAPQESASQTPQAPKSRTSNHSSPSKRSESQNSGESFDGQSPSGSGSANFVINPATGNKVRRNYKNMTRERRVEANARERTRVHTIGSAFDMVHKLLPSLSSDQKMSKLSILRVACKYILLLAAMNGLDYSADKRAYTVEQCIEMLNDTILSEAKAKRSDK